jgi:hypothetical protein
MTKEKLSSVFNAISMHMPVDITEAGWWNPPSSSLAGLISAWMVPGISHLGGAAQHLFLLLSVMGCCSWYVLLSPLKAWVTVSLGTADTWSCGQNSMVGQ